MRRWLALSAVASLGFHAACAAVPSASLSPDDRRAIRALDSAYVAAWIRDDTAAVIATLANDAVLMPAGHRPLTTPAAIRAFWWPTDSSHTRVTGFARQIDELEGAGDLAYLRGTDSLGFTYEKGAVRSQQTSRSMTLAVVRRGADGRWRISRMMWATRT